MPCGSVITGPVPAALSLGVLLAAPVLAGQGGSARTELEALRARLEAAASRSAAGMAAPRGGRVYRLAGFGAVLVLSPRVLPRRVVTRTMVSPPADVADTLAAARRGLEERLSQAPTPRLREELRRNIEKLRATEAELRRLADVRPSHPPARVALPVEDPGPAMVDLSGLEREMEAQMAAYAAALRGLEAAPLGWPIDEEREIRRHLRLVEEHAEAFRLEAERARRQVEREVRRRLVPPAPPAPAAAAVPVAEPAAAPAPPAPPAAHAPAAPPAPATPAGVAAPPLPDPPEAPEAPPPLAAEWPVAPARWRFWFDLPVEPRVTLGEMADPDPVVAAVREALAASLVSHPRPLASLEADDQVAVAVDFVADGLMRAAPVRTLVVRVRAGDLEDRRRGRITAAELRERIAFDEE